jgi:hypothetical protein
MTTPLKAGQRFQVRPFGDLATDPYWITIDGVGPDGSIEWADDDGMGDTVSAAEWAADYEPRIVAGEVSDDTMPDPEDMPDRPNPHEDPEYFAEEEEESTGDEPEPVPGEEEYAPPAEPQPAYVGRNATQKAAAADNPGIDPTDRMPTPLERLADMVNRKFNCEAMARKFQEEAAALTGQIWKILTDAAKAQLMPTTRPAGVSDPLAAALGEAIKERVPQQAPAPADEIPFGKPAPAATGKQSLQVAPAPEPAREDADGSMSDGQARRIAEHVANQARQKLADGEYAKVAKLEMNRAIREVKGISDAMAGHMATAGIKTLGQFSTVANERPDDWFARVKYVTKEKAAAIEGAIETHWKVFKAKYGR